MRVVERYSHLNGEEHLLVHHPRLWDEIQAVVKAVDAEKCRTKVSEEKTRRGRRLYSPVDMNKAFKEEFERRGWRGEKRAFWVTSDEQVMRVAATLPADDQKEMIEKSGRTPIHSYNQTDFVKDRVAVEVQFGKYAFVAHDLFVKHMSFFVAGVIDVGVEILPMKELEKNMSSGVPYYERDLLNLLRQGRSSPAVPLVLLGVAPDS